MSVLERVRIEANPTLYGADIGVQRTFFNKLGEEVNQIGIAKLGPDYTITNGYTLKQPGLR